MTVTDGGLSRTETLRAELETIWEARRRLTPSDVVDVATAPDHPLHSYFEWDDTEAAHRYRISQASRLIRSVKINITTTSNTGEVEDYRVRSWLPLRAAGDETAPEGYLPEVEVREDPQRQRIMLQQMQREMQRLHRRHRHLAEYWAMLDELSEDRPDEGEAATG